MSTVQEYWVVPIKGGHTCSGALRLALRMRAYVVQSTVHVRGRVEGYEFVILILVVIRYTAPAQRALLPIRYTALAFLVWTTVFPVGRVFLDLVRGMSTQRKRWASSGGARFQGLWSERCARYATGGTGSQSYITCAG